MIFRLGITESARNASDWNGDATLRAERVHGRDRRLARLDHVRRAARSETRPATGSGSSAVTCTAVDDDEAAAELDEALDRQRHLGVAHADDDDVVRVVRERRGEGAAAEAEAAHEAEADPARAEMALDHRDLREVALRVGRAVASSSSTSDSVTIWPGTRPITRAGPPSHSIAKSSAATGRTRTLCVTHSGTGVGAISSTARPRLSTISGTKRSRSGSSSRSAW